MYPVKKQFVKLISEVPVLITYSI